MRFRKRNAVAGGFAPAATKAWIAQAVDCELEGAPGRSSKPPSLFCRARMNASAAGERLAVDAGRGQRLHGCARVVGVGCDAADPRKAAAAELRTLDHAHGRGCDLTARLPKRERSPVRRVERLADRAARVLQIAERGERPRRRTARAPTRRARRARARSSSTRSRAQADMSVLHRERPHRLRAGRARRSR